MSYNGSGTFQINTSGQPVVAGTVISSTAFNALTADLATGLSTAITKDGQTTTTVRIPFAQGINSSLTTDASSTSTGSMITAGGVGIAKALYVGTTANVAGAVTLQSTVGVTGIATFSAQPVFSTLTASKPVFTDASKGLVSTGTLGTDQGGTGLTSFTANGVMYASSSSVLATGSALTFDGTNFATTGTASAAKLIPTGSSATGNGMYLPAANSVGISTNGTNAVYIDSSGNVGIGTSSPSVRLEAKGASGSAGSLSIHDGTGDTTVSGATAASLLFQARDSSVRTIAEIDGVNTTTNGTGGAMIFQTRISDTLAERMRIDSSGNLIVGDTTTGSRLKVKSTGTTNSTISFQAVDSGGTNEFYIQDGGNINTGLKASSPYNQTTGAAANMVVDSNGNLNRSTSSLKYKTNVNDATHGLVDLLKLRSVTYKGKNDGDIIFGGFIAEEVDAAGLNEFVQYAADGSPDALAYGNMVSLCVKAIQEQQALIITLTARITALENK